MTSVTFVAFLATCVMDSKWAGDGDVANCSSLGMISKCRAQNESLATLLARLEGILGLVPRWMVRRGRYSHRFYTRAGILYERPASTVGLPSSLAGCAP